jgi:hypothetical protein
LCWRRRFSCAVGVGVATSPARTASSRIATPPRTPPVGTPAAPQSPAVIASPPVAAGAPISVRLEPISARRSRAISPCSLNGAAVAVLIGNRVGGRLGVTGRSDDRGSCASPPRSDTARYPSWVVPRSGGRSQGTSTIQHYQWSPVTAVLVAGLAAAGDVGRVPPQLVCPDGLPRRVGDVRARRLAARTPCLVSARQTVLTCQGPTR